MTIGIIWAGGGSSFYLWSAGVGILAECLYAPSAGHLTQEMRELRMVITILLAVGIAIAFFVYQAAYTAGKRDGSRKAYGVGFGRGYRKAKQSSSGCLVAVLVLIITAVSVVAASTGVFAGASL